MGIYLLRRCINRKTQNILIIGNVITDLLKKSYVINGNLLHVLILFTLVSVGCNVVDIEIVDKQGLINSSRDVEISLIVRQDSIVRNYWGYKVGPILKFKAASDRDIDFTKKVSLEFRIVDRSNVVIYKASNLILSLDSISNSYKTDMSKFKKEN